MANEDEKYVLIEEAKYDNYFPLIRIYLDKTIDGPDKYREVFQKLQNSDDKTKIQFILNTPGGALNTTIQFVDLIKSTKAKTEAIIYKAMSAGSVIALCCDIVNPRPNCMMMIHTLQYGDGRIKDINKHDWRIKHYMDITHKLFSDVYRNFLTENEIKKVVHEGYEFWLNRNEIIERAKKAGKEVIE